MFHVDDNTVTQQMSKSTIDNAGNYRISVFQLFYLFLVTTSSDNTKSTTAIISSLASTLATSSHQTGV
jgi:hypothetical protein